MRKRNNNFAAAFDYLKRNKGIKTQKKLAELMGVSEDTITRILKDRSEVTEDVITKLQTASGCIFNLQWLRGEDDVMLAEDVGKEQPKSDASHLDFASYLNALLAKSDETIASLKRELAAKDDIIKEKDERIASLQQLADERLHRIAMLRHELDVHNISVTSSYPFPIGTAEGAKKSINK